MNSLDDKALKFEDIEPHLGGVKCIGFDVFDTMLLRPFMNPTDLFAYLEEKESSPGFHRERINAERRARKEIRNEINIDEIYSVIDERFRYLKDKEIDTEYTFSTADPDIKKIYDRIADLGIEVVIVSDMYISGECISRMLEKNGYSGYRKVYVSNEHGVNKHTGELFSVILKDLDMRPDEMLFVGDNVRSDHRVPLGMGIKSVRYVPAKERYEASHKREMRFRRRTKDLGSSVIVAMDMFRWLRNPSQNEDYWYDIAYRFGGPVSSFFTQFVMSNITETTGSIFFISRDGYNLQKVYNILCDNPINSHYIYASRLFTIIFGDDVSNSKDGARCLFEHFSDVEEVKAAGLPEEPSKKGYQEYLNKNFDLFKDLLKCEHERYSDYLRGKAGEGDVVVVDVTTMKYSSQNLVRKVLGPDRRVVGCYYNLMAHGDLEYTAYADRSRKLISWTEVNVPEFFLGSPEAPIADITAEGSPIFQKDIHEPELFRMSIYGDITRGELDYAADLRSMFGSDIPRVSFKTLDKWLKVLVKDKLSADPEHLSKIRWAPDTMHTRYRSLVFGPREFVFKTKDLFSDLLWRLKTR